MLSYCCWVVRVLFYSIADWGSNSICSPFFAPDMGRYVSKNWACPFDGTLAILGLLTPSSPIGGGGRGSSLVTYCDFLMFLWFGLEFPFSLDDKEIIIWSKIPGNQLFQQRSELIEQGEREQASSPWHACIPGSKQHSAQCDMVSIRGYQENLKQKCAYFNVIFLFPTWLQLAVTFATHVEFLFYFHWF